MTLCQQVVADYKAGLLDFTVAARKIDRQAADCPLEAAAHGMLYKISNLAFDITENYRAGEADKADWNIIVHTVNNYATGNWEPTCWILSAVYGEYAAGELVHSFSVAVRRQNGVTDIATAASKIHEALSRVADRLNTEQTDQRYLQNLASMMPAAVDEYKLANVSVVEHLTEPYHSVA